MRSCSAYQSDASRRRDRAVDAHDVARPRALACEHVERRVVEVAELAVHGRERLLGRGVLGNGREQSRCLGERVPHRRRDDRRRDRSPSGRGQRRRGEQLREPVHGEEA